MENRVEKRITFKKRRAQLFKAFKEKMLTTFEALSILFHCGSKADDRNIKIERMETGMPVLEIKRDDSEKTNHVMTLKPSFDLTLTYMRKLGLKIIHPIVMEISFVDRNGKTHVSTHTMMYDQKKNCSLNWKFPLDSPAGFVKWIEDEFKSVPFQTMANFAHPRHGLLLIDASYARFDGYVMLCIAFHMLMARFERSFRYEWFIPQIRKKPFHYFCGFRSRKSCHMGMEVYYYPSCPWIDDNPHVLVLHDLNPRVPMRVFEARPRLNDFDPYEIKKAVLDMLDDLKPLSRRFPPLLA